MPRKPLPPEADETRQRAHKALTRGRRDTPSAESKLATWGRCPGQTELFTRQDLRTDQPQD